ncbi:Uu.00g097820.m01.CDS01 [Anthostomella pinea]|uniref:Uu.00g097820.m01.CDS01 n=1 Tax=Anthostomella pinea TaxID=933095 RepID=A0AAI8V7F1_9PEZI|nr:Uu.00g097820.m01.CDS01 [Anthostomella pinea]
MSGIINKVKDAVSGHHSSNTTTSTSGAPEGTHGPHGRVGNAADPRIDSDADHRAAPGTTHGTTGHTGPTVGHNTHTGPTTGIHTGPTTGTSTHTGSTNQGPHNSNMLNKADPRVDSDRSGNTMGNTAGDYRGSGPEGVAGPHNSRALNAADPRVDSDRDASRTVGNTYGSSGTAGTTGGYGNSTGMDGTSGLTDSHGTTGTHVTTGTHGSSGLPGTHGATGTHGTSGLTGSHGTHGTSGLTGSNATTGTHGSSGLTGSHGAAGTYGSGPGPASKTAGPHKSDALNKADPRVDSNMDGSKTYGGDKTYTSGHNVTKDPTDAAQVPPSEMRKVHGDPAIQHGDHGHGRDRRNSLATAQETHRGI